MTARRCSTCLDIQLGDYTLFLRENYSGGHSVTGKVVAGGNITLDGFEVGSALPDDNVSNTLVAGGNLHLTNGNVFGAARYGGSYTPNPNWTVNFHRGTAAQGRPIEDFQREFDLLTALSSRLATQPANGTVRRETWNALTLTGTDECLNVFTVSASDFTGTTQRNIFVPAGSFALVNIHGTGSTLVGGFNADLNPARVLYNFVDATQFEARGFGLSGTVLAPQARVTLNEGSWTGGIYAVSLSGNASGRLSPLETVAGATAEVCNETDDNCNGQVDEGFECSGAGSRGCIDPRCGAEGTQSCNPATCGYGACISASCCQADADCASGSYCENSFCTPQRENGTVCSSSNQCATGQCVDGVCCNTACEGQCDACNLEGHGGTCSPLPSTVQCRGAEGACDVAEYCTGSSAACPADAKKPATAECRGSAGVCDVTEFCTGSSNDCPADGHASSTTQCRASAGECDVAESCTGTGVSCPADGFLNAGTACTHDSNVCTSDVCDGTGRCGHPPVPPETSCGTNYGAWGSCVGFIDYCDTTGTQSRTVTASTCGAGTCGPSSTTLETQECTRAAPDTTCAEPIYGEWSACSYSATCAQTGTKERTVTRSAYSCATGRCVASTTTETQNCVRNTEGVQCRAAGVCDLAERCSGGSCPADSKSPADSTCDDSNAGTTGDRCNGAGVCTGCGDGVRNGPEACDDGNIVTESSCPYGQASCTRCNATCTQVLNLPGPYCGDGSRNGPEACDDGNTVNETSCPSGQASCTTCNATCTQVVPIVAFYCGDGVRNGSEACDDGNNVTENSCPGGAWTCSVCNANCSAYVHIDNTPPPLDCPSTTVSWEQSQSAWKGNPKTVGTYYCSGTLSATPNGVRARASHVRGTTPELFRTGSVEYTCNNGSWTQVAGSATCDGEAYGVYHVTCANGSDSARNMFIGFYRDELKRCADLGGLDWWMAQYNTPNHPCRQSNDPAIQKACFLRDFLAGPEDDEVRANGGHITTTAERNQCGTRAAASWDGAYQACKPVPGQR